MKPLSRQTLKQVFKKVKHLHLPQDLEQVAFDGLYYYSWLDQSDMRLCVVYAYKGTVTGLQLDVVRPAVGILRLGFCEFCHKHRKQNDVFFVATETKKRPKGVEYRSRGTWVCARYDICNRDMKNDELVNGFFERIFELA